MSKTLKIVAALAVALVAVGLLYLKFGLRGDLNGAEARRLVVAGARLVDVRSPREFAAAHLPGAVNIPVGDLAERLRELEPAETEIVLYCRSGMRSARAATLLRSHGFSRVHNLGPMRAW
ncbi:MAG: rhodanese-like domain-containing protein [Pseudomonadota bacterium]